jgi:amino-acid N-acetyltransferase
VEIQSASERNRAFVDWFRGASPYINAHRGRTFVIQFGGEAVADPHFPALVHDLALLSTLGVRLVLVHGIRPQIEQRLAARGIPARSHRGLRVTDDAALTVAKEAAGAARVEIEALLSMGLANSPMAGARLRVASGNFVTARPLGVRDGVDYGHTGEIRRVDRAGIERELEAGSVVLVSPIGYSPTGEAFNLSNEEVATALAVDLQAAKLVLLGEQHGLTNADGSPVRELTLDQARARLADLRARGEDHTSEHVRHLEGAIFACHNGVRRAHLLDRRVDGSLLLELFTRDGVGTLVSADPYEHLRRATIEDVGGILELIGPLEEEGVLVRRPREKLEHEIDHFTVVERDGTVIACSALYPFSGQGLAELACLAVHPAYRNLGLGERLLGHTEREARSATLHTLFVLTTRTVQWFRERGFEPASIEDLPVSRQATYNLQRSSRVLVKRLAPR